jgi:hypothetical protein
MKANELISLLKAGALKKYDKMYKNVEEQTDRYIKMINEFCDIYGRDRDIFLFSVPGRSEIAGNHTDRNTVGSLTLVRKLEHRIDVGIILPIVLKQQRIFLHVSFGN